MAHRDPTSVIFDWDSDLFRTAPSTSVITRWHVHVLDTATSTTTWSHMFLCSRAGAGLHSRKEKSRLAPASARLRRTSPACKASTAPPTSARDDAKRGNLADYVTLKKTQQMPSERHPLQPNVFQRPRRRWEDSAPTFVTWISQRLNATSRITPSDVNLELAQLIPSSLHRDSARAFVRRVRLFAMGSDAWWPAWAARWPDHDEDTDDTMAKPAWPSDLCQSASEGTSLPTTSTALPVQQFVQWQYRDGAL